MRTATLACALLAAGVSAEVYFEDNFTTDPFEGGRWVVSDWKDAQSTGKWGWRAGEYSVDAEKEKGLFTTDDMKFYAASAKLDKSFSNKDKDLVVQFTVKHEKKEYAFCGGGYIKLLPEGLDQKAFGGDSPYSIMFGPDLCGYDVSRIHAIFNHEGENLLRSPDVKLEYAEKNEFTHLYTLVVHPDDTYEILLDLESKVKGNLDEDWGWPSKIIPDPEDKKPEDWVDAKKIDDPEDVKPEGYDDIPTQIPDPDAEKPEDWDEEDDGEWEAPMIDNPEYKGPWSPKRIDNPAYKGEWVQKNIPNKDYVGGYYKYDNLAYVGFELWVVNNGSIFDNILVTDDLEYAKKVAEENFRAIKDGEKDVKTAYKAEQDRIKKEAEEEAKASEKAAAGEDGDEDDLDEEEKDEL